MGFDRDSFVARKMLSESGKDDDLVPTVFRGNAYWSSKLFICSCMDSHAGAWEPEIHNIGRFKFRSPDEACIIRER